MRTLAISALLACAGCSYHLGLDGLDGSLFGSHYHHLEKFTDTGELASWSTVGGRTYGTVDLEWKTDEASEKGSMRGDGMSDNLQQTLGDNAIEALGDDAKCVLNPASCVSLGAAAGAILAPVPAP